MTFKKRIIYLLFIILYGFSSVVVAEDKILVILASDNVSHITIETVSNLYSFRQKLMPNNQKVRLTHLPINSADTIGFTQKVFNYYPYQLKRLWDRAIFSGKARSPKSFKNYDDLLHFIKSHNNAIGYLFINTTELSQLKEKYNVIATIG